MIMSCLISVQSANSVRITDFGLAKLLNYNEEEYRSTGGKVSTTGGHGLTGFKHQSSFQGHCDDTNQGSRPLISLAIDLMPVRVQGHYGLKCSKVKDNCCDLDMVHWLDASASLRC